VARRSRRGAGDREGAAAAGMLAALVEGARQLAGEREQLQVPSFSLTEAGPCAADTTEQSRSWRL